MKNNIDIFVNFLSRTYPLLLILELMLFPAFENLYGSFVLCLGWAISKRIVFRYENILHYPLSTMMVSGFILFYFYMPLPATLIEFKPISYNMISPYQTFTHLIICLFIILTAFHLYRRISKKNHLRWFWNICGVFKPMSKKEFFFLFSFSFIIYFFSIMFIGRWTTESASTQHLFVSFMGLFKDLPVLLLFPQFLILKNYKYSIKYSLFVILYGLLLFIVGIATNVRTAAIVFIAEVLIVFFYLYFSNMVKINLSYKILSFLIIGVWFFTGPFQNLSTAMISVRAEREDVTGTELLSQTIERYNDKQTLHEYNKIWGRNDITSSIGDWDEYYLDNTLLSRFCSLKIFDMTISVANKIGYGNTLMKEEYEKQMIALLPNIICSLIGMTETERENVREHSETDFMYNLASPNREYGSFRIGSFPGLGLAIFGYYYPFIFLVILLFLFYLYDSIVFVNASKGNVVSVIALISLFQVFYMLNCGHNYHTEPRIIIRGFWEMMFVFILTRAITSRIFRI